MSDDRPTVRFVTVLVADDIRREANGKDIIIGVYTTRIGIASIQPSGGIIIAVSLLFEAQGIGKIPISLQVIGPSNAPMVLDAMITSNEINAPGQINALSLTGLPIPIQSEGKIVIKARQYEDEWQTIRVIDVVANPNGPALLAGVPDSSSIVIERSSLSSEPVPPETPSRPERSLRARPTRRRRS